jgi:hypothetical protein
MKRLALAAAIGAVVFGSAGATLRADDTSNATTKVFVTVDPNVAVRADQTIWDLGSVQQGGFSALVTWRVDANSQFVNMQLEASDLYKGDDPTNDEVSPIPLAVSTPASVRPANGNETNSGDNLLAWDGGPGDVNGYPTQKTEVGTFESSQSGHFSQQVTTTVRYTQNDPEKPQGQYSGVVRLYVLLSGAEVVPS